MKSKQCEAWAIYHEDRGIILFSIRATAVESWCSILARLSEESIEERRRKGYTCQPVTIMPRELKVECGSCKGRGNFDNQQGDYEQCGNCEGTGSIMPREVVE